MRKSNTSTLTSLSLSKIKSISEAYANKIELTSLTMSTFVSPVVKAEVVPNYHYQVVVHGCTGFSSVLLFVWEMIGQIDRKRVRQIGLIEIV